MDVKIRYLGKSFATLPLDITSAMTYESTCYEWRLSSDSVELMQYLGFIVPERAKILSPAAQLAQKTAATLSDPEPRPGDIKDMKLLFDSVDAQGSLSQYREILKSELSSRGIERPYHITEPRLLREQYLEMGGLQGIFDSVIRRLNEEIEGLGSSQ